jgi:hypothetical protein
VQLRSIHRAAIAAGLAYFACGMARSQEPDAKAILDKAIEALGGAEKLAKISAFSWTGTVTFKVNGRDQVSPAEFTASGLEQMHRKWRSNVAVVDGDKGWQKGGGTTRQMRPEVLAREKRSIYLQVIPVTLLPIKGKGFKYEAAGEANVGEKPAVILKVTAPDGKEFTLFFDKETGLPAKEVSQVAVPGRRDVVSETTFADYKDFGGIKKATKIEFKSSGFGQGGAQTINEFKVLEEVPDGTFAEPN